MKLDPVVFATILGMGAVTYATRVSGLWLLSRLTLSPRLEAALRAIPGAVMVALIAPVVFTTGPAETLASGATVAVAVRTRSLLLAMVVGVVAVVALRKLMA